MPFTFAGQYGPDAVVTLSGAPQPNAEVTVLNADGSTLATVYTDRTKGTTAANPVVSDSAGNLRFFANPGQYVLSVTIGAASKTFNIVVPLDPAELGTDLTTIDGGAP